jgi:hypothetical protein
VESAASRGLHTVLIRSDSRQRDDWSLDSIAASSLVAEQYAPMPARILGVLTVDHAGAVAVIADAIRGTPAGTIIRARLLASLLALPCDEPRPTSLKDPLNAPMWGAAITLLVSRDDTLAILAGLTTPAEVAIRRGLPDWLVQGRELQEVIYGRIHGDIGVALARTVGLRDRMYRWLRSELRAHRIKVAT